MSLITENGTVIYVIKITKKTLVQSVVMMRKSLAVFVMSW